MSHAAPQGRSHFTSASTGDLTPGAASHSTKLSGPGDHYPRLLHATCAEIAARWRRYGLSEADAQAEADRFAERYRRLQATATLAEAELDATLLLVADAMAAS